MKTKIIFAAIAAILSLSCTKLEGTITVNLENDGYATVALPDFCEDSWNGNTGYIGMDSNNNLFIQGGEIASVGSVGSLARVKRVDSGYSYRAAAESGHGYVGRSNIGKYVRIYVVDIRESTKGGIIGARIEYEYPATF